VYFLQRGDATLLVFEVGKRTVAFGYQEQRFKSAGFLAYMIDQAHEVRLWREVSNPDRVPFQTDQSP
jgi:hypothetical protein